MTKLLQKLHVAFAYGSGGFIGIWLVQGDLHAVPAVIMGVAVINPSYVTRPFGWAWDRIRSRTGHLTRREVETLNRDMDEWAAEHVLEQAIPFQKWTEVGKTITQRFAVASAFKGTAAFGPEACGAFHQIIMDMARKLDTAVDNAWAKAPPAEVIKRASTLGAASAAQNDVPSG